MFAWTQRWFMSDLPFDCFYTPLILTSGPVAYFPAHYLQHWSEHFFAVPAGLTFCWNIVPGITCILLGGMQWWMIELIYGKIRKKWNRAQGGSNKHLEHISDSVNAV
jgi:hypothetical protein